MSETDNSPFTDGDDPFSSPQSRTSQDKVKDTAEDSGNSKSSGGGSSNAQGSGGIAIGGKRVDSSKYAQESASPAFPGRTAAQALYTLPDEHEFDSASYEDLHAVNVAIHKARYALNRSQGALTNAQRQLVTSETNYRHAHARALITITGGTEKTRTAVADLETEDLFTDLLVKRAVVDEVTALIRAINRDIESLTVLSHNLRAQMNIQ